MRQFGRNRLEDNPGWHRPSEHKSKAVLATALPNIGCRKGGERRSGPESSEEGDEIKTGRSPVMLLPRRNLAEQAVADRRMEERSPALDRNDNKPGRNREESQENAKARA